MNHDQRRTAIEAIIDCLDDGDIVRAQLTAYAHGGDEWADLLMDEAIAISGYEED